MTILSHITKANAKAGKQFLARRNLIDFTEYTFEDYETNWHHKKYAAILDKFASGEIKRLMVSLPPQTGKSELCSRRLPAFLLGRNPNLRVALVAYNDTFSSKFNRDVQRIIDSPGYRDLFPNSQIFGKNVRTVATGNWLRNSSEFEIVGYKGSFKSVGVGGPLTGNKVDVAIIDDPYKDAVQANSQAYKRQLEEWWTSVLETRLHNDSRVCLTFTRWRHDDIAGYLLEQQKNLSPDYHWHVVKFQALKEGPPSELDPREPGEALWPERQSKQTLINRQKQNARVFEAMYQQNPTPSEGNLIKESFFPRYELGDLPDGINHCYIDTASSEKELKNNDPTGILVFRVVKNKIYLIDFIKGMWDQIDLVENIKLVHQRYLTGRKSKIIIENKSNGKPTKVILERETAFSVLLDNIKGGKLERLDNELTTLEAGRVLLPKSGFWTRDFLDQLKGFPMMAHDEEVDCLTGCIRAAFGSPKRGRKVAVTKN